jgi:hypothetical protein
MNSFYLIKSCGCLKCNSKQFKENFKNWTSGNNDVDRFIQSTQLSDHNYYSCQALEWIPYDRFHNIKFIAEDEFDNIYIANWIDGCIASNQNCWNDENQDWNRNEPNMFVKLKILNDLASITLEFINKV